VVDGKPHIRTFLADALEELGFITHHCGRLAEVAGSLADFHPDLIVLGHLAPESEVTKTLHLLFSTGFKGRVMIFGARAATSLIALHELGEQIGLTMLPPLATPYRDSDLRGNLSPFLPIPESPSLVVDVEEAMRNGWLEMWYQPKIDLREMLPCGAEALVRMRHPTWGIVPPAAFIPKHDDPNLRGLSEFVVKRVMEDWTAFSRGRPPLDMTIHLPTALLEDDTFVDRMCLQLPDHTAFARLFVEISSVDVRRDHALVRAAAKQLENYNVGISVGDVMAEASWVDVADFPIAELQIDGDFINGVADDRAKRTACEMVVDIARKLKAKTLAKNLERTADCRTVIQMDIDSGQGFLFAKPMEAHRFTRTVLRRKSAAQE
jgi:EAL domain-containing protein (putative c-di-GMP-specific phosphodiesterase class I)